MRRFTILLFFFLIGCTNNDFQYEYHPNGEIKSKYVRINGKVEGKYYSYDTSGALISISNWKDSYLNGYNKSYFGNGNVKTVRQFKNDTLNGLYKEFYQNGKLKIKGYFIDGNKSGYFDFYDKEGNLKARREYINLNGDSYLNQVIKFNAKGDTLFDNSSFLKFYHPDSAEVGDSVELKICLRAPAIQGSQMYVFFELPQDTSRYRRLFSDDNFVNFRFQAIDTGAILLRGFIEEFKVYDNPIDSIAAASRRMYFESEIYIKQ